MFDMHRHGRNALGREAVATTVLPHPPCTFLRKVSEMAGRAKGTLPLGLLDGDVVATPRQQQPCMRLADEQTTILVQEFLETHGAVGRELAGTLAVKQGM